MEIALILARSSNGVIGSDNKMPWHLPADFAWFKQHTLGKAVIMGRKTFESIGKPLNNRYNIVLSSSGFTACGIETAHSLDDALTYGRSYAQSRAQDEIMIIGGLQIFAQSLPLATKIYLTTVLSEVQGDCSFADDFKEFHPLFEDFHPRDQHNCFAMKFQILSKERTHQG